MFAIPNVAPVAAPNLFDVAFEDRILDLLARPRRVAYYYDTPDTSTFRYRILNMVQALDAWPEGGISASWFCRPELDRMAAFIDRADVLVICRAAYTPAIEQMVARARNRGMKVFYDCDDLVFDPIYTPVVMKTLDLDVADDRNLSSWFAKFARAGAALRLCDASIATNACLAARMRDSADHPATSVIPNFLHRTQQRVSTDLFAAKRCAGYRSDERLTIGYFSGSPSHNRDFAIVAPALGRLMDEDPSINLRVVGFLELQGRLAEHADRIDFVPLQDPLNLQRHIAETEINIAPLQQNVFTQCKSELKFFEAAIVGTVTIATPTHAFAEIIEDGENGFLAEGHLWEQKLREAIAVVRDRERYAAMAQLAFDFVVGRYGWDRFGSRIAGVLFG